jgi:hypothetical protein
VQAGLVSASALAWRSAHTIRCRTRLRLRYLLLDDPLRRPLALALRNPVCYRLGRVQLDVGPFYHRSAPHMSQRQRGHRQTNGARAVEKRSSSWLFRAGLAGKAAVPECLLVLCFRSLLVCGVLVVVPERLLAREAFHPAGRSRRLDGSVVALAFDGGPVALAAPADICRPEALRIATPWPTWRIRPAYTVQGWARNLSLAEIASCWGKHRAWPWQAGTWAYWAWQAVQSRRTEPLQRS